MKTKTLLELLKKHGVHIYDNDEALISEVETEYKNQFSQLPASVTDKDIERMTEAEFPTTNSIYDRVQEKRIVYAKGLKDMRSLLNHPPVMGEGWVSVEERKPEVDTSDECNNRNKITKTE